MILFKFGPITNVIVNCFHRLICHSADFYVSYSHFSPVNCNEWNLTNFQLNVSTRIRTEPSNEPLLNSFTGD